MCAINQIICQKQRACHFVLDICNSSLQEGDLKMTEFDLQKKINWRRYIPKKLIINYISSWSTVLLFFPFICSILSNVLYELNWGFKPPSFVIWVAPLRVRHMYFSKRNIIVKEIIMAHNWSARTSCIAHLSLPWYCVYLVDQKCTCAESIISKSVQGLEGHITGYYFLRQRTMCNRTKHNTNGL